MKSAMAVLWEAVRDEGAEGKVGAIAKMDDVFGLENFVSLITFAKTSGQTAKLLSGACDYLLWFAKNRNAIK